MTNINPLSLCFIILTESGTDKEIRLRADLIGAYISNTRGTTDVYTQLKEDGDSKVFSVMEHSEDIADALARMWGVQEKMQDMKVNKRKRLDK